MSNHWIYYDLRFFLQPCLSQRTTTKSAYLSLRGSQKVTIARREPVRTCASSQPDITVDIGEHYTSYCGIERIRRRRRLANGEMRVVFMNHECKLFVRPSNSKILRWLINNMPQYRMIIPCSKPDLHEIISACHALKSRRWPELYANNDNDAIS